MIKSRIWYVDRQQVIEKFGRNYCDSVFRKGINNSFTPNLNYTFYYSNFGWCDKYEILTKGKVLAVSKNAGRQPND